ncbi:MAG: hypothetical protein U5K38_19105 [Woeseiaceae bacterium]|nr:hypothetical protein [Woeseiaceae bacterium]
MIRSLLSIWNIPASLLTLEITESSIMTDVEASFATMNRLKELGAESRSMISAPVFHHFLIFSRYQRTNSESTVPSLPEW